MKPDIDGFSSCKKIRETERLSNALIYYITAIPKTEVIKRLKETEADGYLLKFFDFSRFEPLLKILNISQFVLEIFKLI